MNVKRDGRVRRRPGGGAGHTVLLMAAVALLLGVMAAAGLAACASLDKPVPDPSDASMSPGATLDTIGWSEAADSVGQHVRVEGPVAKVTRVDGYTELSVGLTPPDPARFVIAVPRRLEGRFDGPLRDLFEGAMVRVTGTIERIDGATGMRITSPRQLKTAL